MPRFSLALLLLLVGACFQAGQARAIDSVFASTGAAPLAIAMDSSGNVYTANYLGNTITKITPGGSSSTLGPSGDAPSDMLLDSDNNIYTMSGSTVLKITQAGDLGLLGFASGGAYMDIGPDGSIFVADRFVNHVYRITPDGNSSVFASIPALPLDIVVDNSGNIYTANPNANTVTKITTGGEASTLATVGNSPDRIAVDWQGNVYTLNTGDDTISKIMPSGAVTTFSGMGSDLRGLVVDTNLNLYTIQQTERKVVRIAPDGTSQVIGSTGYGANNLLVTSDGNTVYVANTINDTVSRISMPKAPTIDSAPSETTNNPNVSISFHGEAEVTFTCQLDAHPAAACTSPYTHTGLSAGTHVLRVKEVDAYGNISPRTPVVWTVVDDQGPSAPSTFTGVSAGNTTSTAFTVGFTLAERGGTVECQLDSGSWAECDSVNGLHGSHSLSGLGLGAHTLHVRQTDDSGNVGTVGSSPTWTVVLPPVAPKAPTILHPSAKTKTVYQKARRWYIKNTLLFSDGGDKRAGAAVTLIQVAVDSKGRPIKNKPGNTRPPSKPTSKNGALRWSRSGKIGPLSRQPYWVRAGNASGAWSAWVKLRP